MTKQNALRLLRRALELVQAGDTGQALEVLEGVLAAATSSPGGGGISLPDGVLPWLHLARASLKGSDRAVPPFLALQTAIVLLEV